MSTRAPLRVVIAGGGVAGLEAALALRAYAGELVEIDLLSPASVFTYKPMLVAQPFGTGTATEVELGRVLDAAGARHHRDALVAVEPGERIAIAAEGERIEYDALLVAPGARAVEAVPGALTFGDPETRDAFGALLETLGREGDRRLAFVVPPAATWSIAAYELALQTAAERDLRLIGDLELALITPEAAPLEIFGRAASERVAATLQESGVAVHLGAAAESFEAGELRLAGAPALGFDRVVALPRLEVAAIAGLPHDERGFLPTDELMRVTGLDHVWAAGDVSAFPVKQGGLAAQQADTAAAAIAARAGAAVEPTPFAPVLRAALITGRAPEFLQAPLADPAAGTTGAAPAPWAPRAKLAAAHLGPELASALGDAAAAEATLGHGLDSLPGGADLEHARAVRTLLVAADTDANLGDYEGALGWLSMVERLDLAIPAAYVVRRDEWRRRLDPALAPDSAAERIEGRFASSAEALSDLQRRLGWMREFELRTGGEMLGHRREFERGIEDVRALSRRTGNLGREPGAST